MRRRSQRRRRQQPALLELPPRRPGTRIRRAKRLLNNYLIRKFMGQTRIRKTDLLHIFKKLFMNFRFEPEVLLSL